MTDGYLPIVILAALATAFALLSLAASAVFRPRRAMAPKADPYECGIVPERLPAKERFPVKFYVVAMLFIIFDIEIIFLFPFAVAFDALAWYGVIEMFLFILTVFIAYVYVWRRGGLEWD